MSDERAEILQRMDWLDDRERLVLSLRYGLAGEQPQTLKEIGRAWGSPGNGSARSSSKPSPRWQVTLRQPLPVLHARRCREVPGASNVPFAAAVGASSEMRRRKC